MNTYSKVQVNILSNNRDIKKKCQSFCTTTTMTPDNDDVKATVIPPVFS